MPEMIDEAGQIESTTVNIYRTAATVKGGRRFSFGALVVVGDRQGKVGYGYAKSTEVPVAIEKAQRKARRGMVSVKRLGTTVPHEVETSFSASKIRLIPATPGTGIVAGATVRAVLEMAGYSDCITKSLGSGNKLNVVKAVIDGLAQMKLLSEVAERRGIELEDSVIEQRIERARALTGTGIGASTEPKGDDDSSDDADKASDN
ncbi:MAG: 30S ribosomal protein S5 [Phycisphaerales bacterium JB060]